MDRDFLPIQLQIRGYLKTLDFQEGRWYDAEQENQQPSFQEDEKETEILTEGRLREAIKQKREELKRMQVSQLMKTLQIAEIKKEQKAIELKLGLKGVSKAEIEKEKVVEDDLERSRDASQLAYEEELLDEQ